MILHPRRAWSPHSSGSGKSAALGPRGTIHGRALLYVTVRPASLFSAVLPESAARTSSGCRRNFCRILQGAGTARISRRNDRAGGGGLLVLVAGCWLLLQATATQYLREVGCIWEGNHHLQKCAQLRSPFFHDSRREAISNVHLDRKSVV